MFSLAIPANHMSIAIYKWNYGNMAQWPQHVYKQLIERKVTQCFILLKQTNKLFIVI